MRPRFKLLIISTLIIVSLIIIIIFSLPSRSLNKTSAQLQIVTTLFPLADIAQNIGGEEVTVLRLLKPGLDAHTYEPSPLDFQKINQADIFIYTGPFMEPWAEKIIQSLNNPELLVINASEGVNFLDATGELNTESDHQGLDPHVWLDLGNLEVMAKNIGEGIKLKLSSEEEAIAVRQNDYLSQIRELDEHYQSELANCRHRQFIYSGHYAFAYLSQRYNLSYQSLYGLSPDAEPSAAQVIEFINKIKEAEVNYIFFEELLNPRLTDTLKKETGITPLALNDAHNLKADELAAGKSLLAVFQDNLATLKLGLECY
ncbi:MAG: metal ABC transporter solute-binding protein, Zn/Mn family [Patescibacteria group bacterium]|jgi:zinc transport system substrate-binding protein